MVLFSSHKHPPNFVKSTKEEKWIEAMKSELQAIEKNITWELVVLPVRVKIIWVKWIFKTKLNGDGQVNKYKARLVVKGYAQKDGINYDEVFALVARWDTIRIMLAIAAQKGWAVYEFYVMSAFLYGELKEVVCMDQPEGFVKKGEEDKVYRLNKSLYDLKQAPRAWFSQIESYFIHKGFEKSNYDRTLFSKSVGEKLLMVSLYINNLIFIGNDDVMCEECKQLMKQEFEMIDLRRVSLFFGVEVHQSWKGIHLSQKTYAKEMLKRFRM